MAASIHDPGSIENFVCVTEIARGDWLAADLFQRKFGQTPPTAGRHTIALVRSNDGTLTVANYLHCWRQNAIGLLGGSCTDGNVRRVLTKDQAALIRAHGGLMAITMRYALSHYGGDGVEAFFAHCGDSLSLSVLRSLQFETASAPHLLVWWPKQLSLARKAGLIAQAASLGPF